VYKRQLLRFLTLPLKELTEDIRTFRRAGLDKSTVQLRSWPESSSNEIHELGKSFNNMAEQIKSQFSQLQDNDKQRRELLAHLSHDLRTPLASLQGYLETIELKGKQLTDEQHQKFIGIAFKNANQLRKLVDQIFELAHLEGGLVKIDFEIFPLAELLHDIVAKFDSKLLEKDLKIIIEPNQCDFTVHSDIGKLERILTNLIENAIRHSNQNGQIILKTEAFEHNKIRLQVIDKGTGINEQDIIHIFEARYRASNAVDDTNAHSGLGLAISQKLMGLLNSKIQVESQLNQGTTFSFELSQG